MFHKKFISIIIFALWLSVFMQIRLKTWLIWMSSDFNFKQFFRYKNHTNPNFKIVWTKNFLFTAVPILEVLDATYLLYAILFLLVSLALLICVLILFLLEDSNHVLFINRLNTSYFLDRHRFREYFSLETKESKRILFPTL